jgi:hypothetical protein
MPRAKIDAGGRRNHAQWLKSLNTAAADVSCSCTGMRSGLEAAWRRENWTMSLHSATSARTSLARMTLHAAHTRSDHLTAVVTSCAHSACCYCSAFTCDRLNVHLDLHCAHWHDEQFESRPLCET